MRVDPDVVLPPERLKTSVAMTVQIERATMHSIPGSERIVAKHEHYAADRKLGIRLHTRPVERTNTFWIDVAGHQVLFPVQLRQNGLRDFHRRCEVTQMP